MDVNEEVKTEDGKNNENSVTDLPVPDEQADATKGGKGAAIGLIVGGAAGAGSLA